MNTVMLLDPNSIIIAEDRWREAKPDDVEQLAKSFLKFGQLQPIVVESRKTQVNGKWGSHWHLVAGLHRVMAAQANATPVKAIELGQVDAVMAREMELEENIQRVPMTWQERAHAVAELTELKGERDPTWTQERTAAILKVPQARVSEALKVNEFAKLFPEIREAKSMHQALKWSQQRAKSITRVINIKDNKDDEVLEVGARIVHGDSVDVIKTIADSSFDLILTDPPFGIDYDSRKADTSGSLSAYQDDSSNYEKLLTMAPDLYRVIKDRGFLIWFLGFRWYPTCLALFREVGFIVDEIPIIWDRSDGRSFTTKPEWYFGRGYDIALHCRKGDAQIVQRNKSNILRIPPVGNAERELLVERPVALYQELIRRLTYPGETVADFFCGSGSVPAAAASLQRKFWACEKDAQRRAVAIEKVKAHMATKER